MVLTSNFAKRNDSENAPPTSRPAKGSGHKSLISRLRDTSLRETSRRRRARTTGGSNSPKYAVEQAKRRSEAKSTPSPIRFSIAASSSRTDDVEMQDVAPVAGPSRVSPTPTPTSISLPRELLRPEYIEISKEAITAVDPELASVDLRYIREQLEDFGPGMLRVLASVQADPVRDSLPKELAILVHDLSSDLPTHMLAIYGRRAAGSTAPQKVTLFPIHSVILASYCAKLPEFSIPSASSSTFNTVDTVPRRTTVPILPLRIPYPNGFPALSAYLYTKDTKPLLASILPPAPRIPPTIETDRSQIRLYANMLAGMYTPPALLYQAMAVHGLWQNVCALGIFDDELWDTMDLAWEVMLSAVAVASGNPDKMLGTESGSANPVV